MQDTVCQKKLTRCVDLWWAHIIVTHQYKDNLQVGTTNTSSNSKSANLNLIDDGNKFEVTGFSKSKL